MQPSLGWHQFHFWRWTIRNMFLKLCPFSQLPFAEKGNVAGQDVARSTCWVVQEQLHPHRWFCLSLAQWTFAFGWSESYSRVGNTIHTLFVCCTPQHSWHHHGNKIQCRIPCPSPQHSLSPMPQALLCLRLSLLPVHDHTVAIKLMPLFRGCISNEFPGGGNAAGQCCFHFEMQASRCSNWPK